MSTPRAAPPMPASTSLMTRSSAATDSTWSNCGLGAGRRASEGYHVANPYQMEERLPLLRCPTIVIAPKSDPYAHPVASKVAVANSGSRIVKIENAMLPLPDQMPGTFCGSRGKMSCRDRRRAEWGK
jgi:hypothetical protein